MADLSRSAKAMKQGLAKHLWRSIEVRRALKKEAWRLLVFVGIYVGTVAVVRYVREKPIVDGVLSALLGAFAVALAWLISVIRTLRVVLRDHGLID